MKSMKKWAARLAEAAEAGEMPSPAVFAAFCRDYLSMADHADRQIEAAALYIEARAQAMRLETRHDRGEEALALLVAASDVRAGLHIADEPPRRRVYVHVETGDLYEMYPVRLETKNDLTGDWDEGVAYRSLSMRRDVLYVTSQQRFDDRFLEVEDPDER